MVDPIAGRTWAFRGLFVVLILLMTFGRMLPLGDTIRGLPGPDLMAALTCAWVLRRPAYVPAPLIVAVFLFSDFMLQHPPGLGALAMLAGSEVLRARHGLMRELPFPAEWALVAATVVGMSVMIHLMHVVLVIDRPPLGLQLVRGVLTAMIYPVAVLLTAHLIGIRKPTPGEVDALGARL